MSDDDEFDASDISWEEPQLRRDRRTQGEQVDEIGRMRKALFANRGRHAVLEEFDTKGRASARAGVLRKMNDPRLEGLEFTGRVVGDHSKLYICAPKEPE